MALVNSGISSSLVKENVDPAVAELVFRKTDMLKFFMDKGRILSSGGANPIQWNANYAGNTSSEVFVEGQAAPVAGQQSYVRPSLTGFYVRAMTNVSGHVRDQIRNGGVYDDAVKRELISGTADLYVYMETQFNGSTQDRGIASIIDSGDTYAGTAPGSYSLWASLETAVGGAMSLSVLETMFESLIGTSYGANPTDIWCAQNQINNYLALAGPGAGTSSVTRMDMTQGSIDYGLIKQKVAYNQIPFTMMRNMTTTEFYMLDMGVDPEDFCIKEIRPIQVDDLAKTDDGEKAQISWAGCIKVKNRRLQGKLTGVTA